MQAWCDTPIAPSTTGCVAFFFTPPLHTCATPYTTGKYSARHYWQVARHQHKWLRPFLKRLYTKWLQSVLKRLYGWQHTRLTETTAVCSQAQSYKHKMQAPTTRNTHDVLFVRPSVRPSVRSFSRVFGKGTPSQQQQGRLPRLRG